jgi:hypothetical protein
MSELSNIFKNERDNGGGVVIGFFLFFLLGVQGLRAFLPRVEFLKHPAPEPNEDLVNKWICQSLPFLLGTIAIAAC